MTAFNVLTEFQFEIAEALAKSDALAGALGKVENQAENLQSTLMSVGGSLIAQIGLYGGVAGAVYNAVKAVDKYEATQRGIANLFIANKMFDGVNELPMAMDQAAQSMEKMRNIAHEFSLPMNAMLSTTKQIGAVLLAQGLDDSQLTKSTDISRMFLKAAPTLGVDPGQSMNALVGMVTGHAYMNDMFTQRIMTDTQTMRGVSSGSGSHAHGGMLGGFNALPAAERVEKLSKALGELANNSKINELNAQSLSNQLQRLADNFTSAFSFLAPIGKLLIEPFRRLLAQVNTWLETQGKQVAELVAKMFKGMFDDLPGLYGNLMALRSLRESAVKAGELIGLVGIIHGITWALSFLGIELQGGLIMSGFKWLMGAMWDLAPMIFTVANFFRVLSLLRFLFIDILAPFVVFTAMFAGIKKGLAEATADYVIWFAENAARITAVVAKYKDIFAKIFSPLMMIVDGFAMLTRVLWSHTYGATVLLDVMESLADFFNFIGDVIVHVIAEISGVISSLMGVIMRLIHLDADFDQHMGDDAKDGYKMIWDKYHEGGAPKVDHSEVRQSKTYINTVNIQNAFKEQMEPDRIAFSLKEQLLKAAANPTQSTTRGFGAIAAMGG